MRNKKELDFPNTMQRMISVLSDVKEMVLSTSSNDRVTSRIVSTAFHEQKIIFMSWGHHTKCVQMRDNPAVALCNVTGKLYDNVQVEGIASILGDALAVDNMEYIDVYKKKQPDYFKMFSGYKGMQLVVVEIKRLFCFGFEGMELYTDRIDLENETAYRKYLDE